jgi:hypothetical protein
MADEDMRATLPAMVWLIVYREGPIDAAALEARLGPDASGVKAILEELQGDGRVQRDPSTGLYRSGSVTIAVGDRAGWEAAVLDHFQGVAKAIAAKVRLGPQSELAERIGGATLSFDVYRGHPLEQEVYGLLGSVRARVNEVWNQLAAHNRQHPIADQDKIKVTFYLGQNVERPEAELGVASSRADASDSAADAGGRSDAAVSGGADDAMDAGDATDESDRKGGS